MSRSSLRAVQVCSIEAADLVISLGFLLLLGFVGLTIGTALSILTGRRQLRVTATVFHMEQTGFDAVPIVTLLSFLVADPFIALASAAGYAVHAPAGALPAHSVGYVYLPAAIGIGASMARAS